MILAQPRPWRRRLVSDMTPMIDVVLQLIIFFMYTSQFQEMTRTEVELPREQGESDRSREPSALVIDVRADGVLVADGHEVGLIELARMVAVEIDRAGGDGSKLRVLIRADRAASSSHINRIAETLVGLGATNWKLGTTAPAP